jgi:hypothetical protein
MIIKAVVSFMLFLCFAGCIIGSAIGVPEYYYIDEDLNVTVSPAIPGSNDTFILIEQESGYTDYINGSNVYDMYDIDSTVLAENDANATWYGIGNNTTLQNKTVSFDFLFDPYEGQATQFVLARFGFTDDAARTHALYLETNNDDTVTYGSKHAYGNCKDDTTNYSVVMRSGNTYYNGPFTFQMNDSHVQYIHPDHTSDTKTGQFTLTQTMYPYVELLPQSFNPAAGNAKASMTNITVRDHFDDAPTVTELASSSDAILYKITNPNGFNLTSYEQTLDPSFIESAGESLRITSYNSSPVPYPLSPANGATLIYDYPPVTNDINLTWYVPSSTSSYAYEVRTLGGTLQAGGSTSSDHVTVSLPEGSYYWTVTESGSTYPEMRSYFTISNTYGINGTAIIGTVYYMDDGLMTAIPGAAVHLYNDTFTDTQTVGIDGYFSFTGLANNKSYYLKAAAGDYDDSEIQTVTTTNETLVKNILLVPITNEYMPHYVRFGLQTIFGTKYPGVTSEVYRGSSIGSIPYRSGVTGTDGSVTFRLDQNQQYTLYFYGADVEENITLYPKEESYTIYIGNSFFDDEDPELQDLDITVTKNEINSTHAYVNVSYADPMNNTNGVNVTMLAPVNNNWNSTTTINSYSGSGNTSLSWMIEDYTGKDYRIDILIDHEDLGEIEKSYAVHFFGMENAHGFDKIYPWIALFALIFVGGLFKPSNVASGSMVVCAVGWVFLSLGWFDPLGEGMSTAISIAMGLATTIAIVAVLAKGRKDG